MTTDIEYDLEDQIVEIEDSLLKISDLLNGLVDKYSFQINEVPSYRTITKLRNPPQSKDEELENALMWVCQYKHIMLHLNIIEDYVRKCSKNAAGALKKVGMIPAQQA